MPTHTPNADPTPHSTPRPQVGPDAAEIMQGLGVALKCGATKAQFDSCVGIHPSAAEEWVTMSTPARCARLLLGTLRTLLCCFCVNMGGRFCIVTLSTWGRSTWGAQHWVSVCLGEPLQGGGRSRGAALRSEVPAAQPAPES